VKNNNYTEGKWQTTFKIEAVDQAKKTANNITIGNIKIDTLSITPLGINITGNSNALKTLDIQVTMQDGTTLHYTTTHSYEEDKKSSIKYLTYTPLKIEDIKEVRINGNSIDFK
jgi:D-hexose-6-phosphate mutarotase